MKLIIQWIVIILFVIAGITVGHLIKNNLTAIGVTFITLRDIGACYFLPTLIFGLIGFYISFVYIENKL